MTNFLWLIFEGASLRYSPTYFLAFPSTFWGLFLIFPRGNIPFVPYHLILLLNQCLCTNPYFSSFFILAFSFVYVRVIGSVSVVPTRTLPWIWSSNGKILRGPYKKFWILHLWRVFGYVYMTNCSYFCFLWLNTWSCVIFLSMLCLWWLVTDLTYPLLIKWVIWWFILLAIRSVLTVCSWLNSFESLTIL